jgi:hypothetical protein
MQPRVGGINWDDLKDFVGDIDLGFNNTGVIRSSVHFTGDEIIVKEEMPAPFVQDIMDSVAALSAQVKRRRPGGHLIGQLPLPLYYGWRKEWERTGKQHGVLFRAFLMSKLMDSDYSKFRVR